MRWRSAVGNPTMAALLRQLSRRQSAYSSGSLITAGSRSSSCSSSSSSEVSSSLGSRGGSALPMTVAKLQRANRLETFPGVHGVISASSRSYGIRGPIHSVRDGKNATNDRNVGAAGAC